MTSTRSQRRRPDCWTTVICGKLWAHRPAISRLRTTTPRGTPPAPKRSTGRPSRPPLRGWAPRSRAEVARPVYYFTDAQGFGGAEHALLMLLGTIDRKDWSPTLLHHSDPTGLELAERAREIGVPVRPVPRLPFGVLGVRRVPGLARELR